MKIEVTKNVFWDTESKTQSEEANKWLLSIRQSEATVIYKDGYSRPYKYVWKLDTCTVTVEKEFVYKNSSDWTLHKNIITVKPNN